MISVIMPVYNSEHTLEEALCSAMAQSWQDLEILVLDDGSTDGSRRIARELADLDDRIRLLPNEKNRGVEATRNRGLDLARGEWIAFLDADDAWLPDKLEKQMIRLDQTGGDLCYTGYSFIDRDSRAIRQPYEVPEGFTWRRFLAENVIGCSTALFKKPDTIRLRTGYGHEDYVFWLELLRTGYQAIGINEPLMRYRVMETSRSGDKKRAAVNRWRIYRQFLGLDVFRSAGYFAAYAARGLIKHRSGGTHQNAKGKTI
jgi:teichuronic acid biosynthesis glycosyltransferase TuaG